MDASNTPLACPICGRVIQDNEILVVTREGRRNWWVTWHYYTGDVQPDGKPRTSTSPAFVEHGVEWFNWCGQADIQTVVTK